MSNKLYDVLKWFSMVFLPALIVFVGVVLKQFNVDCTETVIIIMTAFNTFLGSILGISSVNYKKGAEKK